MNQILIFNDEIISNTRKLIQREDNENLSDEDLFVLYNELFPRREAFTADGHVSAPGVGALIASCIPNQSLSELERHANDPTNAHGMLLYADCLRYGLRGARKNEKKAYDLYHKAALLNQPEALVTMAHLAFIKIAKALNKYNSKDLETWRITRNFVYNYQSQRERLAQMWHWLDKSAELGWRSMFLEEQALAAEETGSWFLSEAVKKVLAQMRLFDNFVTENQSARFKYKCHNSKCNLKVKSLDEFKVTCQLCPSAKYCSIMCQMMDWKDSHAVEHRAQPAIYPANFAADGYFNSCSNEYEHEEDNEYDITIVLGWVFEKPGLVSDRERAVTFKGWSQEEKNAHADIKDRLSPRPAAEWLTKVIDKYDLASPNLMEVKSKRVEIARIHAWRAWCNWRRVKMDRGQMDPKKRQKLLISVIDDCGLVTETGLFITHLDPKVFMNVRKVKYNARKLLDGFLASEEATSNRPGEQETVAKKKKKKRAVKKRVHHFQDDQTAEGDENTVDAGLAKLTIEEPVPQKFLVTTEEMILKSFEQASATFLTLNDVCWICHQNWNEFVDLRLVTILPCSHSACSSCLIKMLKTSSEKQKDGQGEYNYKFSCGLCLLELDETIPFKAADHVMNNNLVPSFFQFISTGPSKEERRERRNLIYSLLVDRFEFDVSRVEETLFNLIEIMDCKEPEQLTIEEKSKYHELAHAPVKFLNSEYQRLRDEVNNSSSVLDSNWLVKKERLNELKKQIMAAKENAYNDIYERMNSCGSMGICLFGHATTVDLHGLSEEAAKRFIDDPILPVLPVLKKITIITGRGLHSEKGEAILKPAIKAYLTELNIQFKDVEGNDGAINVFE